MIVALITGRVTGKPTARTLDDGTEVVTCRMRCPMANNDELLIHITAHEPAIMLKLLRLKKLHNVTMSGELTIKPYWVSDWMQAVGYEFVAHDLLSALQVKRHGG
jgi:hypothetical protein